MTNYLNIPLNGWKWIWSCPGGWGVGGGGGGGFHSPGWSAWNISAHDPCWQRWQRGHSLLWLPLGQWCSQNDALVLTASASPQQRAKAELSTPSTAKPPTTRVCRSAWEKLHETREKTGELGSNILFIYLNFFGRLAKSDREADSAF